MTDTTTPKRGRGQPRKYALAESVRILGHPCPHTDTHAAGYCRRCANYAAQKQRLARRLTAGRGVC
jgi:hypothetical protein